MSAGLIAYDVLDHDPSTPSGLRHIQNGLLVATQGLRRYTCSLDTAPIETSSLPELLPFDFFFVKYLFIYFFIDCSCKFKCDEINLPFSNARKAIAEPDTGRFPRYVGDDDIAHVGERSCRFSTAPPKTTDCVRRPCPRLS